MLFASSCHGLLSWVNMYVIPDKSKKFRSFQPGLFTAIVITDRYHVWPVQRACENGSDDITNIWSRLIIHKRFLHRTEHARKNQKTKSSCFVLIPYIYNSMLDKALKIFFSFYWRFDVFSRTFSYLRLYIQSSISEQLSSCATFDSHITSFFCVSRTQVEK